MTDPARCWAAVFCFFFLFHFHFHNSIIHKFSWWPTMCHFIKAYLHTQSHILVLGLSWGLMLFHDDWPCTIKSKHTSIIHTQSRILVLGLGLGHMLFSWWPTMNHLIKAYLHHPNNHAYWYWVLVWAMCCFMMNDHVPSYQSIPPPSILNHVYWYWVLAWAMSFFMMTDHVISYQSLPPSLVLNHAYWYWVLAQAICCFMMTDHVISHHPMYIPQYPIFIRYVYIYLCIYVYTPISNTQYPIPNTKKGHQKIPFLLTSLHNTDP